MKTLAALLVAALPLSTACLAEEDIYDGETVKTEDGKDDSSSVALFVDFSFDAELFTTSSWNREQTIEDQLLYTIGQLNGDNSVGRLDRLTLTNVGSAAVDGGTKITYHASLLVSWGDKQNVPDSYTLKLPRDMSYQGIDRFVQAYSHSCVDWGAHDVDSGSMWYYYRPARSGCELAAGDVVEAAAAVSVSPVNTTGKYPEYHKVWEDNVLEVVAIFGKFEDGATSGDAGIDAYNTFVRSIKTELQQFPLTTTPASVPSSPGVAMPDVELRATLPGGKSVRVVALLTDNVRDALATSSFRSRYEALSTRADLIAYNGHAGLGANIRALARAGKWVAGQYVIVFENGCDTYAYVDTALEEAHRAINPDDTTGTKYVDTVTNGMPAFFANMAGASMSLIRGLIKHADPQTYETMFRSVDRSQVIMVTGEQDNTFQPGGGGGEPQAWAGIDDSGTIARNAEKRWATPTLAAGSYLFEMTGTSDADLYVRRGSAPTTSSFDCRPYKTSSSESCRVTLSAPAVIHVMIRGWASSSEWDLVGRKE